MLAYQSSSFHDAAYIRQLLNLRPAPEFERWLEQMKIADTNGRLLPANETNLLLDKSALNFEISN